MRHPPKQHVTREELEELHWDLLNEAISVLVAVTDENSLRREAKIQSRLEGFRAAIHASLAVYVERTPDPDYYAKVADDA